MAEGHGQRREECPSGARQSQSLCAVSELCPGPPREDGMGGQGFLAGEADAVWPQPCSGTGPTCHCSHVEARSALAHCTGARPTGAVRPRMLPPAASLLPLSTWAMASSGLDRFHRDHPPATHSELCVLSSSCTGHGKLHLQAQAQPGQVRGLEGAGLAGGQVPSVWWGALGQKFRHSCWWPLFWAEWGPWRLYLCPAPTLQSPRCE